MTLKRPVVRSTGTGPEGPLSRTLIRQWYERRFRKGTMMFGLTRQSPMGQSNKVAFLIVSDLVWTEANLRKAGIVDRFQFEALVFVDGKLDSKMSGTKAMLCEPEAFKNHVKGLTFLHADGDSDTTE